MNREILRLALPNIVSNITVPVMGIASTMIAGNLGGGDTTRAIGSLAVGVSIFNFIYWNCSFLRMGTSGLTAQAYGAKNHPRMHRHAGAHAARRGRIGRTDPAGCNTRSAKRRSGP